MNLTRRIGVAAARPAGVRGAFTFLEVLVSVAVIVGALAGIAALLPAAGARLGEATAIDRAGTMAANARADLATRGFMRAAQWQAATGTTSSTRAIVCGEGLTLSNTSVAMTSATPTIACLVSGTLQQYIAPATGFRLADSLQAGTSGVVTGTTWGVCYGCMISSPAPLPVTSGSTVRLTTVVFRKPAPAVQGFALTGNVSSPVFQVSGTLSTAGAVGSLTAAGMADMAAAMRKRFLPGCSWALVVPAPGQPPQEPRWVQVASSWTTSGTATGPSYVTLSGTDHAPLISGGTLRVFGFDGLMRVDERWINLE